MCSLEGDYCTCEPLYVQTETWPVERGVLTLNTRHRRLMSHMNRAAIFRHGSFSQPLLPICAGRGDCHPMWRPWYSGSGPCCSLTLFPRPSSVLLPCRSLCIHLMLRKQSREARLNLMKVCSTWTQSQQAARCEEMQNHTGRMRRSETARDHKELISLYVQLFETSQAHSLIVLQTLNVIVSSLFLWKTAKRSNKHDFYPTGLCSCPVFNLHHPFVWIHSVKHVLKSIGRQWM